LLVCVVQSSVVGLSKLLVREKADTRDNKGFYLICQSKSSPELYEFVCRSVDQRQTCIQSIRHAIARCSADHGNNNNNNNNNK